MFQLTEPFYINVLFEGKEYKLIITQSYWLTNGPQGYRITAGNTEFHVSLRFKEKEWLWSTLNEVKHWHLWNAIIVQLEKTLKEMVARKKQREAE